MNTRIKELAEQALKESTATPLDGTYRAEGYLPSVSKVFADKFAELIVKECSDIAMREDHDPAECIKRHFGVE